MELRSQLSRLSGDTLAATLDAAMVVAAADGRLTGEEVVNIAESVDQITEGMFDRDQLAAMLASSLERLQEHGPDVLVDAMADALDADMREVAVIMASATAWAKGGVGESEGMALQHLSSAFGIDEEGYMQLLSLGRELARA